MSATKWTPRPPEGEVFEEIDEALNEAIEAAQDHFDTELRAKYKFMYYDDLEAAVKKYIARRVTEIIDDRNEAAHDRFIESYY